MSGQVAGTVVLPADAGAVSIVSDGLVFEIDTATNAAKLIGSAATPPKGDLLVPASVTSGTSTYEVTAIAKNAFAKCPELTSVSLPATLRKVDPDAVAGCSSLKSITVSAKNEAFASYDGMLFTKDYTRLLLIPEGMEGAANIPGSTIYVPAQAFSLCHPGSSLTSGDGSTAFASLNGMLFSKDMKTLVVCPQVVGRAVVLPAETEVIGEYAHAGCKDLASITALGNVREIDPTAFVDEAKASAVVALPAGESKAVWEQAGFQHFAEPAEPGTTTRPEAEGEAASGFVFTLLDDYTLSVTWEGEEDPAPEVVIPASAEINGVSYRVSTVAANAFANRGSLTSMKLPASITSLGEAAFAGCANLADVNLPDTLQAIGERAFEATSLTDVWLPGSIQSIGPRAFASCESLTRIVALGTPEVAEDALAGCANLSVYCPYDESNTYPWNLGLLANNNHLLPYGLALPEEPLQLELDQQANLFETGLHEAPEVCEVSYSYAAKPISVAPDGTVTGKASGTSEVTAILTLNNQELARATRTVEVSAVPEVSKQPSGATDSDESLNASNSTLNTSQTQALSSILPEVDTALALLSADSAPDHISLTAALATGETFKATAPTGQTLTCTVLADEPASVEVALADESKPIDGSIVGGIVIPTRVNDPATGTEYIVKGIGVQGFMDVNLTAVSFEAGSQVSYIGEMAFNACKLLSTVVLPASLQTIAPKAFGHCFNLTTLEIPDSVTSIGIYAFQRCVSLSYISIGSGVTALPDSLFYGDFSLETLVVRGSIATFGVTLFQDTRPSSLKVYVSSAANKTAWENANQNGSYGLMPSNIIVADSFYTVTFKDCGDNGKDIVVRVADGEAVEMLSTSKRGFGLAGWYEDPSFDGERWDFSRPVNRDVILHPRWIESFIQDGLEFTMLPDGNGVAVGAVNPASMTGNLVLPESVTIAGSTYLVTAIAPNGFAFSAIDSVELPSSLESIEVSAFNTSSVRITNLGSLANLKKIAAEAFFKTNLTELVIPASVETIQRAAFHSCASLESVTFAEGSVLAALPDECFNWCSALKSIVLPAGLKSIEYYAFYNNQSLVSIILPEGLEFIGSFAFSWCAVLRSIVLPSTVTNVGPSAFISDKALVAVSLPSGLRTLGSNAFKGCTALNVLSAHSSMTAIADALKPSSAEVDAFTGLTKANITVALPAAAEGGSEIYEQMKDVWGSYHFTKFSPMSGALPLASDTPGSPNTNEEIAGWTLSNDGTLIIHSTEKIANFGWIHSGAEMNTQYWGPVRLLVTAVDTTQVASVDTSTACWFRSMSNLVDISRAAKIPDGVTDANNMFAYTGITSIPAELSFPSNIEDINALFNKCLSIKSIPDWFDLPEGIKNCGYLFGYNPNLTGLPEGFHFPSTVEQMAGFFRGWTSLTEVPSNFVFPDNVWNVKSLFEDCTSLTSLPADFKIPDTVTDAYYMFGRCSSLTSLPEKFSMPQSAANSRQIFYSDTPMPLYYAGNDLVVLGQTDEWWSVLNRTLITPKNKPAGASTVTLNIKNEGEAGEGMFWSAVHTDASGLFTEPAYVPSRPGMVFTLWYADPDCTQRVDFSKPFEADTTIYGKLAPGTRKGELPCQAGTGSAFWSLTDDGTLYIRGGGAILGFGWFDSPDTKTNHWAPYRRDIVSVQMCPSIRNNNFSYWFYGCTNLTDISGFVMPENVVNVGSLFQKCSSLKIVPEGFSLAPNTIDTYSMFAGSAIVALPSSFKVPASVSNPAGMFYQCKDLASLPAGFSFTHPEVKLFNVLRDCPSLTSLPDGFSFPLDRANLAAKSGSAPFGCDVEPGTPRVATYYCGDDPNVLEFDWASQNRTLITTGEGAADKGLYPVEYKVMNPDRNVFETSASAFTTGDGLVPDLGTLQKLGYGFIGWFADEDCLEAFDFSRPVTGATTLYAKWAKHGGKGTDEGILPTISSDGTTGQDAWWGIATDGALHIVCENGSSVSGLGFTYDTYTEKYWEPYANEVNAIRMERNVKAKSMTSWFQKMSRLQNVEKGFFIPENCIDTHWLFYGDVNLQVLPRGFFGNAELKYIGGMFQGCSGLTALPDDFILPTSVVDIWCLFSGTGISALPEGFKLHEGLAGIDRMFAYCPNLMTLPEDFKIPSTALSIELMFYTCPKLTALPAHLFENVINMPENGLFRENLESWNVFGFNEDELPDPEPLPTYFPASDNEIALIGNWDAQHRTIVKADPSGRQHLASLRLPDATGNYPTVWKTLYANAENIIEVAPVAAPRAFQTFKGWYSNAACTNPVLFPLELSEDTDLYALYETTGGTLPTINPDGTEGQGAQWSYDQDTHVLKIEAIVPGAKIKKLFKAPDDDAHASPKTGYWSPFRAHVLKVQMSDGILVGGDDGASGDMDYWFSGMFGLNNIHGVYVPEGTVSLDHTFNMCTSLAVIPGTLTLPDSLTNMAGTFRGCKFKTLPDGFKLPSYLKDATIIFGENKELVSLPEGFTLPEGVSNAGYLFWNCPKLKQLPSSFLLPKSLSNASKMFGSCSSLTSLPAGFTIPASTNREKKIDLSSMFTGCTTLAALPEGFSIPDSSQVSEVTNMFRGCSALTSLPASLDLRGLQNVLGVEALFAPAADAAEITTYYVGLHSDLAKLSVDGGDATATTAYWKDNYKRNLVATNGGTSMPEGTCTVNFMVPDTTGNSGYTLWQSVVVAQGSTLVDPQLASRYGVAFEGWFDEGGKEVVFGTTIEPNATAMTLYARFTAPILKATAPASAKITVDASGTITKAPLRLTSQTAAPVRVVDAVATPNAEADMAVASSALDKLHLIVKPLVGKGSLDLYLDGVLIPSRPDGFVIPTATGPANPGVLDCSIGIENLNPTDIIFYRDGFSTGLADITFTFEIAK